MTIFEQVTVDATAGGVSLSASKIDPPGASQMQRAVCRVRTAQISFTYDGTPPTVGIGTLADVGDVIVLMTHDQLSKFRAIRTGLNSGQLDCNYSR